MSNHVTHRRLTITSAARVACAIVAGLLLLVLAGAAGARQEAANTLRLGGSHSGLPL